MGRVSAFPGCLSDNTVTVEAHVAVVESYCVPNFDSPSIFARILDKDKVRVLDSAQCSMVSQQLPLHRGGTSPSPQQSPSQRSKVTCQTRTCVCFALKRILELSHTSLLDPANEVRFIELVQLTIHWAYKAFPQVSQ